ncbi:hypothetical protein GGR56DRAFT_632154 [Xylariaceae sp. FL0804]|nr:hypothetical protein GGR56DRAFT_632154 [Xylariaceae sp. FL0804]
MSTDEDQELMEKIRILSDRIDQHKAEREVPNHASFSYHRAAPYPQYRGGYRGRRGRPAPLYRNRTLVLNGHSRSPPSPNNATNPSESSASSWVTKTDRHLQLINTAVYDKETQQRTNAIEQTQRQKQQQNDNRERNQLVENLRPVAGDSGHDAAKTQAPASRYEVVVDGIRFHVSKQGSKLVKAPDDVNPPSATPKVTYIGGVKLHRTKNGNLVRHGILKNQRMAGGIKKIDEQCKAFSWTGTCPKGPRCRYIHDVSKTAICRKFLLKGSCQRGDDCDLSHDITEERTPLCLHFAQGNCNNPSCSYVHAEHAHTDPVCRAFGIYGYCDKGAGCPDRHVFECPDFSNMGVCKLKGCKRQHVERASVLRKANNARNSQSIEDAEDVSSDDDDAADSDDVDSDEIEEFIGQSEGAEILDFAEQKDFIGFG